MAVCLYPISIVLYADLCRLSQTLIPLSPPLVFFGILPLLNVFSAFFTMFVFTEGTDEAKISGKAPQGGGYASQLVALANQTNGNSTVGLGFDDGDLSKYLIIASATENLFGGDSTWESIVKITSRVLPMFLAPRRIKAAFELRYRRYADEILAVNGSNDDEDEDGAEADGGSTHSNAFSGSATLPAAARPTSIRNAAAKFKASMDTRHSQARAK